MLLRYHNCIFVCRKCLSSYTIQNGLMKHKERCGQQKVNRIETSIEPPLYRKKNFHKNPLYFRIYADFEADNEIDDSNTGSKTTNFY